MSKTEHMVVWSGRDPLLPEREERWDRRFDSMPSFDLDDDIEPERAARKYTYSGKYKRANNGGDNDTGNSK